MQLFIGIMSGTSLDGVDAALVTFENGACQLKDTQFLAYPTALKSELLALHSANQNELEASMLMGNKLAGLYADAVKQLLDKTKVQVADISAIGCHGQTIRHRPELGFTLQIGNAALLAELTNITVVSDFRSRDIAAGGQGAPLVPAFHQAFFADKLRSRAIINIGGIANITYLGHPETNSNQPQNCLYGFDSGPGNMLLDAWIKQHQNRDYDANGDWASTGETIPELLTSLLAEPFFALAPPKSTGRDLFNTNWLEKKLRVLAQLKVTAQPQDVAYTLVELTARSIYLALTEHCGQLDEVYLCGGGAHNQLLSKKLQALLGNIPCNSTDALGVGVDWVEAIAFAWLAKQCLDKKTANLAEVTGATGPRILGAIYQN